MNFQGVNEFYDPNFVFNDAYDKVLNYLEDIHQCTLVNIICEEFDLEISPFKHYGRVLNNLHELALKEVITVEYHLQGQCLYINPHDNLSNNDLDDIVYEMDEDDIYVNDEDKESLSNSFQGKELKATSHQPMSLEQSCDCVHEYFRNLLPVSRRNSENLHPVIDLLHQYDLHIIVRMFRRFPSTLVHNEEEEMFKAAEFDVKMRYTGGDSQCRDSLIVLTLEIGYLKILASIYNLLISAKRTHLFEHQHFAKPFMCRYCHKYFDEKNELLAHVDCPSHIPCRSSEAQDIVYQRLCYKCFSTYEVKVGHVPKCGCRYRKQQHVTDKFASGYEFGQYFNTTRKLSYNDLMCLLNLSNTSHFQLQHIDKYSIHYPWVSSLNWSKRTRKNIVSCENSSMLLFDQENHVYSDEKEYIDERTMYYFPYITHFDLSDKFIVLLGVLFDTIPEFYHRYQLPISVETIKQTKGLTKSLQLDQRTHLVQVKWKEFLHLFFLSVAVQDKFAYYLNNFRLSYTLSEKIIHEFGKLIHNEQNEFSNYFLTAFDNFKSKYHHRRKRKMKHMKQSAAKRIKVKHIV